jgi:hypothetical protein
MSLITVGRSAHEEVRLCPLGDRDRHHPLGGVEKQREVSGASGAEPEMFSTPHLSPIAVESGLVRRISFRQKQLPFAKRKEGNGAGGVGTFLQHGLGPVFSLVEF